MPPPAQPLTGRLGTAGLSPDEIRKRAQARLAERIDPARSRHKPLSLLRQEARRVLDLYLELEVPFWPKADRDRLAEEVVGETTGLGPLDELFRDEATHEFMVLAHNQVIARKGDVWLPTSVHFRDPDHYRRTLARMAEQGEPVQPGPQPAAALDVRLANGFRVVAVLPPAVLDQPPVATFVRGAAVSTQATPGPTRPPALAAPTARPVPPPSGPTESLQSLAPGRTVAAVTRPPANRMVPATPAQGSGVVSYNIPGGSGVVSGSAAGRFANPMEKARQRITERMIMKLASAGVYDIAQIPPAELHKVVALLVAEFCETEKLGFDPIDCDQLTLEILAGIHR